MRLEVRAKDVCTGHAPALPVQLKDTHGAGMGMDFRVAFADAAAAQCWSVGGRASVQQVMSQEAGGRAQDSLAGGMHSCTAGLASCILYSQAVGWHSG